MRRNRLPVQRNRPGLKTSLIPEDRPQYRIVYLNGYPVTLVPFFIPFAHVGRSGQAPGESKPQDPFIKPLLTRLNADSAVIACANRQIHCQMLLIAQIIHHAAAL